METNTRVSASQAINQVLETLNEEGGFTISVLTDAQGLVIASHYQEGSDPERQSAVVAAVQRTVMKAAKQLGMVSADEIALYGVEGQRLVCRPIEIDGYELILAVMVPGKEHSYRRAMNQALTKIRKAWKRL